MRVVRQFWEKDVLEVAPALIGKMLVRRWRSGEEKRWLITEVEAYRGEEDLACHARSGRTKRTEVMYQPGGRVYVYLIYGKYWMLNVVTGKENQPQAVLIRGVEGSNGPGKLGQRLGLDKSFYGEDINLSLRLWIEDGKERKLKIERIRRVGVEYAGRWAEKLWRWKLDQIES